MTKPMTRRRTGRGFQYFDHDEQIKDKTELTYLASLAIPPAWQDVEIAHDRQAQILATGYDKAGRKQYIYHPDYRAKQDQAKFERILRFATALPAMRETTSSHLRHHQLDREKVMACVVRLMDEAYFRVGNDEYAKKNQTYGLTTLRSKHTTVTGATILFDYIGKSGQHQVKKVTDRRLATIVKQLDALPGYEVFKYYDEDGKLTDVKSDDVNVYIREIMGDEFSAKDFRTWGGTLLAAAELTALEQVLTQRERQKAVTQCVKTVARRLGNTPAIARSSYIDPRVIDMFMDRGELRQLHEAVAKVKDDQYLTAAENALLKMLETSSAA